MTIRPTHKKTKRLVFEALIKLQKAFSVSGSDVPQHTISNIHGAIVLCNTAINALKKENYQNENSDV